MCSGQYKTAHALHNTLGVRTKLLQNKCVLSACYEFTCFTQIPRDHRTLHLNVAINTAVGNICS